MDTDSRAFYFGLNGPKRPQTPPLSPLRCRLSSSLPAAAIDFTSQNQMSKSRHYHSHSPSDLETAMAVAMEARSPPPPPPQKQEVWLPWLMPCFALANALAFGYSMYSNDCPSRHADEPSSCVLYPLLGRFSFEPMSSNSLLGPSPYTLDKLGALDYKKIVVEGERWRLISCIWLHTGVFHLLANMLSLLFVGVRLEQEFGFVKIGTLYMLSGFGGSLMSCLSIKAKLSVGASGALFGLLGSMVSELITNWTIYANKCEALLTLIVVIAINLAIGILPHVDSSAHVGGFISGFFLGFILLIRPQFGWIHREHIPPRFDMQLIKPKYKVYQLLLWLLALFTLIIWFLNCLVKLFVIRKKNAV